MQKLLWAKHPSLLLEMGTQLQGWKGAQLHAGLELLATLVWKVKGCLQARVVAAAGRC